MDSNKPLIIDGSNHIVGRLASVLAKLLLTTKREVVVLRCEKLIVSGSARRNKLKFQSYLSKRTNTNPKKGPLHFRAPSGMLRKAVRGMIPYKSAHGKEAYSRISAYEGVPLRFQRVKRMVFPRAVKAVCLKPHRKFIELGEIAKRFGWKHADLVEELENKRRENADKYYEQKKARTALYKQARELVEQDNSPEVQKLKSVIAQYS